MPPIGYCVYSALPRRHHRLIFRHCVRKRRLRSRHLSPEVLAPTERIKGNIESGKMGRISSLWIVYNMAHSEEFFTGYSGILRLGRRSASAPP